jgi:hypothetical protein
MYLQVITISDISTADGKYVLPNILLGHRTEDRASTLKWPTTSRPTQWAAWKLLLQHIGSGAKLEKQLRPWKNNPHQEWTW